MLAHQQTRTSATERAYLRRAADLLGHVAAAAGIAQPGLVTAQDVATWLQTGSTGWTAATFRQYRNALAFHFSGQSAEAERLIRGTRHASNGCVKPKQGHTSSRKRKYISEAHVVKLLRALRANGRWSELAADVFEATLATGLRPVEWNSAKIEGSVLIVRNAKATNGRGTGLERRLTLDPSQVDMVGRVLTKLRALPTDTPWQVNIRVAFYEVRKSIWERIPYALYTARHQFSANAKARCTRREVADLMGHKVIDTAAKHYGKRRSAWKTPPPAVALDKPARQNPSSFRPEIPVQRTLMGHKAPT